ncbi:MAG: selenide, water dikinase SelD [Collinsella sp.]|nr:selenide, water dikinase SelD [Collinsella sp.]
MADDVRLTKLAECAGCGAKVGAGELARLFEGFEPPSDPNLLVGFDRSDDAAVYRVAPDVAIVQTLDFFPPIADDPFVFGAIAAANALSDVFAMGGEPKTALNIMMVPEDMDPGVVRQILRGGASKAAEAGAAVCGGHSIYDREPKYGMAVTGVVHPDAILTNAGARAGDALIYTKPLGLGILSTGARAGLVGALDEERALAAMMELNRAARDAMAGYRVHACTDVTGFAVVGHALEMAEGADVGIELDASAFEVLDGARELAAMGIVPAGAYRNRRFAEPRALLDGVPLDMADVLFDPQTSGGLLIAVDPADASALLRDLAQRVPAARLVGRVTEHSRDPHRVVVTYNS